ncbi:competence protein ComGD [Natronobacillus azotifigens]|uniref:Competence type IV pilus minor pilin ComGD n=1 Tax=Natronobacillus azotifigens TaxID=472978 RepID=A0A9J6RFF7_9BACI|nr:competence type IV pilus minor pilin ComGD [Natronobacillus azotifigens]MCZ0704067.1 competence type IV pilus minor pilin ComGD [Natronobacillus azotifigens]
MKKQDGFTFVELLVTISLIMIMITMIGLIHGKSYDNYQFKRWFQQFESDVLFLQQQTMTTRTNDLLNILPSTNQYEIRSTPLEPPNIVRNIPKEWKVSILSLQMPLSYTRAGTIRNPGMFRITTKHSTYDIYFPFGKGRCYFVQR